jgi:hypothetical protein
VIAAQDAALLETVIRREGRSLLQYVSEAYPWAKTAGDTTPDKVRDLARQQRDAVGALTKFLSRRRHTVPYLGPFPMAFTTMNFVSLDYVLPRLADDGRRALAALERDRAALADAEARAELDKLIEQKRRHLKTLEALAESGARRVSEGVA